MSWPLSHEFNEAIQNPALAFADADLKSAEPVLGAQGLPLPRSGNFADVYQLRGADGRDWAVKCFTRPVVGLEERYARVSEALAQANLPFAVGFSFLSEGIRVGGVWRPIVKMEWVEGLLLNQVVRENAGRPDRLAALGLMWSKLCKRLREAGITHADLQHGNVLLVPGSRPGAYGLKLIDYDGMYVPALANKPSGESGHPSYQHPARAATRAYSPDVDRFPHLVVATALKGLAVVGQGLWERHDNGDNLIFSEEDYRKPSASKAMRELWLTENPAVQALVGRLAVACGRPIPQTPWLDVFAPDGEPAPLDNDARREAAAALGIALPVPIPLPPEPSAAPVAVPLPLDPSAVPAVPVVSSELLEAEKRAVFEQVADAVETAPAKKARVKKPERAKPEKSNALLLLLAGGGALFLLLGAVVAGVFIFGGKQRQDDTAQHPDEPKAPGPKEPDPKTISVVPKPKDKVPDPASPEVRPGERFDARQAWSLPLPDSVFLGSPVVGRDGRSAVITHMPQGEVVTVDLDTGKLLESPPDHFGKSALVVPLDGGRFAGGVIRDASIPVWDPRAGKVVRSLPAGLMPVGLGYISPTGKYVAAGTNNMPGADTFKLKSVEPDKVILDLKWDRGSVFFTDDESRVLLADATGRCRWYKLPSGDLDREWTLEKKGPDHTPTYRVMAASGDGSVLAFWGTVGERQLAIHLLDGASGQVQLSIPTHSALQQPPTLSRNGRWLLAHYPRSSQPESARLFDTATGAVVAEVAPPAGFNTFRPVLLPDGRGCVAVAADASRRAVVRYDLAGAGGPPVVVAKPKDPDPMDVKPPVLKSVGRLEVKPGWTSELGPEFEVARLTCSSDSKVVAALSTTKPGLTILDAATGKPLPGEFPTVAPSSHLTPLDDGRFAVRALLPAASIPILDTRAGRATSVPSIRLPNPSRYQFVSPDGKYVAAGVDSVKPGQFKLKRLEDEKIILDIDSVRGYVHFTADPSRVLIAEESGRCRWFKLPSGEPSGEWQLRGVKLGAPGDGMRLFAGASDGSVFLYDGRLEGHDEPFHLIDGGNGKVIRSFAGNYANHFGSLSADGRLAVLARREAGKLRTADVIETATGTVVAELSAPPGREFLVPTVLPDGSGVVAVVADRPVHLVRFDLVPQGGIAVAPKPKDTPAKPKDPPELKARWSAPAEGRLNQIHVDHDINLVLLSGSSEGFAAFDLKTGKPRTGFTALNRGVASFFPLDRGRVGTTDPPYTQVLIWDGRSGQQTGKFSVPQLPDGGKASLRVALSPNTKYLAVYRVGLAKQAEVPFRVFETATAKPLVSTDGKGGAVYFTADSSRILLAESTGTCQWFRLPTGKPDVSWVFDTPASGRTHRVTSVSADGSVLGYNGPAELKGNAVGPAVVDGKTGKVIHRFEKDYVFFSSVAVSDDGKRAAVMRSIGPDGRSFDVVEVATGTVLGRTWIPAGRTLPAFTLSGDGKALVVSDADTKKVYVFDVPTGSGGVAPKPKAPSPKDPPKPGEVVELKERWSVEVKAKLPVANAFLDVDGETIALANQGGEWGTAALDAGTGVALSDMQKPPLKGAYRQVIPLGKGKFAYQTYTETDLLIWDPRINKTERTPIPQPPGPRREALAPDLSPNGRYMAVSHARPNPRPGEGYPESAFEVTDTQTGKSVISYNWQPGRVVFTPDSSRVLVVDATERFRWYKLPENKPYAEWTFEQEPTRFTANILSASADGGVILYSGQPRGKERTLHLLDGTTGKVLHSFPPRTYNDHGYVSDDGKAVALVRNDGRGTGHTVEVLDTRGTLLATAKIPKPPTDTTSVSISWKSRVVVMYERGTYKLTAYDLPGNLTAEGPAPK